MTQIGHIVASYPVDQQMVYIQVTRGAAKRTHAFPGTSKPTVFIMTNVLQSIPDDIRAKGVSCVTLEDKRWLRCEIKSTSMLGNVLAAQHAVEQEVTETILFRDGYLTEASSSNVWIARNGKLYAPPVNNLILEGIRYGWIEEICAAKGIAFEARQISREDVYAADEVFLSSATKEVLAVTTIDGHTIGNGAPGPIYQTLYDAYQIAKVA
jgi:D-alanine transaminase